MRALRRARTLSALAVALAATVAMAACGTASEPPAQSSGDTGKHQASAEMGRELFETGCGLSGEHVECESGPAWFAEGEYGCSACHGGNGQGGRFEALRAEPRIIFAHAKGSHTSPSAPEASPAPESSEPQEPTVMEAPDIRLSTLRAPYHGMDPEVGAVQMPDAANGWTDEQIIAVIRDGVRPDDSMVSELMPRWGFSDAEMEALLVYLGQL